LGLNLRLVRLIFPARAFVECSVPFPKDVCKSPLPRDWFCRQGETEPDVVLGELGPAGEELQRSIVARQRSLSSQTSGPEPSFSEAMTGWPTL
jgi:hypothetical protein